jgi:hypothetical protein
VPGASVRLAPAAVVWANTETPVMEGSVIAAADVSETAPSSSTDRSSSTPI